ncbi:MAG: tol-pal system protein YbgF [bacterium]
MGIRRVQKLFVLGSFLLFVSGCVTSGEYIALKNDVNQLKKSYYSLDKDVAVIKKDVEVTRGAVPKAAAGQESFGAIRDSQEQLNTQLQSFAKEVQVMQGRFDESKFYAEKTAKDNALEFDIIRSRLAKMEQEVTTLKKRLAEMQASPEQIPETMPGAKKGEQPEASAVSGKGDPKALYDASYEYFKKDDYKRAREGFAEFIKRYPDHELADNAHFWIGESYFREKDYENAILAYEKLMKGFPKSPKIPAAMLKQSKSFEGIGDTKTADTIRKLLLEKYPDSSEAKELKGKVSSGKP